MLGLERSGLHLLSLKAQFFGSIFSGSNLKRDLLHHRNGPIAIFRRHVCGLLNKADNGLGGTIDASFLAPISIKRCPFIATPANYAAKVTRIEAEKSLRV